MESVQKYFLVNDTSKAMHTFCARLAHNTLAFKFKRGKLPFLTGATRDLAQLVQY